MKRAKLTLLAVGLLTMFTNCKKQAIQEIVTQDVQMKTMPYAKITHGDNYLLLTDASDDYFSGHFFGKDANQIHIANDVITELANLEVVGEFEFSGSGIISTLKFNNFIQLSDNEFSVDISVNGTSSTVNIQSDTHTINDFKNDINTLLASSGKTQYWWVVPVLGAIYEVVTSAVDHCTTIVTQGIASCNTGCYDAYFCSVHCKSCTP